MKIEDVKKKSDDKKIKTMPITIRITENTSKWLSDNQVSPSKVFREALKDLGYSE